MGAIMYNSFGVGTCLIKGLMLLVLLMFLVLDFVEGKLSLKNWKKRLPPGYDMVDGEAVDVTNKVIQVAAEFGVKYYAFDDYHFQAPIYIRDRFEAGWHFIVFDDPYNQDPGGGHFILLQRISGLSTDTTNSRRIVYEAFLLVLEDSVAADVEPFDPKEVEYYKDEDSTNVKHDSLMLEDTQ